MGANNTALNGNFVDLNRIFTEMFDSINEVNMKDWKETDVQLSEYQTRSDQFVGLNNPADDTTARTGSGESVNTAAINNTLIGLKTLSPLLLNALESLRNKRWHEYDTMTGPALMAELAVVDGTLTSLSTSTPSITQGSGNIDVITIFTSSLRVKGLLDRIEPMLVARRNKDYGIVEDLYVDAMNVFGTFSTFTFTNNP